MTTLYKRHKPEISINQKRQELKTRAIGNCRKHQIDTNIKRQESQRRHQLQSNRKIKMTPTESDKSNKQN